MASKVGSAVRKLNQNVKSAASKVVKNAFKGKAARQAELQAKDTNKAVKTQGAPRDQSTKSDELKEMETQGNGKAAKATEEKPETNKSQDPEKESLKAQLDEIRQQLDEMKKSKEASGSQGGSEGGGSQDGGGSDGGSQGGCGNCQQAAPPSPLQQMQAINPNPNDPDSQLQQMARQILATSQQGMPAFGTSPFGQAPMFGPMGQMVGFGGAVSMGASTGPDQAARLKSALREKAAQLQGQGFQPRPETRALVTQALGEDPFQNQQQRAVQGIPGQAFNPNQQLWGANPFAMGLAMGLGR